jgi:hypothetical protein
MTLPNFLIIGAPKAGTTSLYDHLRAHPEIFMSEIKEPRFFGYTGTPGPENRHKFPIQSQEEYESLFEAATTEKARGEATPHYLLYPQAPERIHALLPHAKLIASLRNPIDRAFSIYQMNLRNKSANAGVPFAEAIGIDHNLREGYHESLTRYFERFPAAQLKVILFDDLKNEPRRTVQGLFAFLGVDPGFLPDLSRISNPGGTPKSKFLHQLMSNRQMQATARKLLPRAVTQRLKDLRSRNLEQRAMTREERRVALGIFRTDIERTQALIGRDLSHWMRL